MYVCIYLHVARDEHVHLSDEHFPARNVCKCVYVRRASVCMYVCIFMLEMYMSLQEMCDIRKSSNMRHVSRLCVCVYVCLCVCVYVCLCVCVSVCLCVCVT